MVTTNGGDVIAAPPTSFALTVSTFIFTTLISTPISTPPSAIFYCEKLDVRVTGLNSEVTAYVTSYVPLVFARQVTMFDAVVQLRTLLLGSVTTIVCPAASAPVKVTTRVQCFFADNVTDNLSFAFT